MAVFWCDKPGATYETVEDTLPATRHRCNIHCVSSSKARSPINSWHPKNCWARATKNCVLHMMLYRISHPVNGSFGSCGNGWAGGAASALPLFDLDLDFDLGDFLPDFLRKEESLPAEMKLHGKAEAKINFSYYALRMKMTGNKLKTIIIASKLCNYRGKALRSDARLILN